MLIVIVSPCSLVFSNISEVLPVNVHAGKLLYQVSMEHADSVKDWVMEGPGQVSFKDGWMHMQSPNEEMHHVFWCPERFPESFIAQWDAQNMETDAGLCIVFFAAAGLEDQSIFSDELPKRDGNFQQYTKGKIRCYHTSYYANAAHNPDRQQTNLRKNPGFHLVKESEEGIPTKSEKIHTITLAKIGSHIRLWVDDRKVIDWTDAGNLGGQPHGDGYIGFRQMKWTHFRYRDFRVWPVATKNDSIDELSTGENGRNQASSMADSPSTSLEAIPGAQGLAVALPDKEALLNEPFAEWTLAYEGVVGNPYDVIAHALFTHETSGVAKRSLMYYDGEGRWNFRFTGTRLGRWTIATTGPGTLGGRTGVVVVHENPTRRNGFLGADGRNWVWLGADRAFVPQLVMSEPPSAFWRNGSLDLDKIESHLKEFIDETGFTGFHFDVGCGRWFDIGVYDCDETHENPDLRTFQFFDELLLRAYRAGAMTHIWLWAGGTRNIGGSMSEPYQRIVRYITARLGPIPGWSMGYSFDMKWWSRDPVGDMQSWYDFMKEQLGGWPHILGARADVYEMVNEQMQRGISADTPHRPLSEVYWKGDYVGHYDYRVAYPWYVKVLESENKPHFSEDRFRIRHNNRFMGKDYTPEMTLRGLWHSTMAGGVANIWGNLRPHDNTQRGSLPYDNNAEAKVRGISFRVNIKAQIKTYSRFWFDEKRFRTDLIIDNQLSGNQIGNEFLLDDIVPISVCLRDEEYRRYIFYSEKTQHIRMDLTGSDSPLSAVAVDTQQPYQEIFIGRLEPNEHIWKAPHPSHWAIAIGDFDD
jgi:hypothetical protein